ncbi:MAG: DUF92 domain-containing protein [Mucilaginibacter sp.]
MADLIVYIVLLLGATLSFTTKKLTLTGAITGAVVATLIYKGIGNIGIAMLAFFFIAGSWATGWQHAKKITLGTVELDKGRRTAGQVLANGGMAALLSAFAWYFPGQRPLVAIMVAGSLAAATADTLSSELGTIYGRRFYNVLTFKKDTRGLDGVISLEGTLAGLVGAIFITTIYAMGFGWGPPTRWIIIAGFTGNLADSILGAWLERKKLIGNDWVNFLNTATGAVVCYLLIKG